MSYDTMEVQDANQRYAYDDKLFVVFHMAAVQNEGKSAAEGRPIFEDVPHVRIHVPGDKTTVIDTPVSEEHKRRFSSRWAKFEAGMAQSPEGTPLEEWPQLKTSQVAELKAANIFTVEQLATMADNRAQSFMGGYELKRKADVFLKVSKDTAAAQKYAIENAELQDRLKAQDDTIRNLSAKVEILLQQKAEDAAPSAPTRRVKADERAPSSPSGM